MLAPHSGVNADNLRSYRLHVYHCRHDHHIKQDPRWKVKQLPQGRRWTTPAGLTYTKGPKHYPI